MAKHSMIQYSGIYICVINKNKKRVMTIQGSSFVLIRVGPCDGGA